MLRTLAAAGIAALTFVAPAAAQQLSLSQVSNYLNTIQSAKSGFTQLNDDGSISTGTLYIKRPGKVRFEYDPPEEAVVLASSGAVYIIDKKLGGQPDTYPLSRTPLSIVLDRNVDLTRSGMVTDTGYDGTATTVTAQDPRTPEAGTIQLKFTADPVELRQWVITDEQGTQTTVVLNSLEDTQLRNSFFLVDNVLD